MKSSELSVPLLDLAPRLKRRLSLWNPLDYLRLLYWALFFPQAVLWYLENFGKAEYIIMEPENIGEAFRKDIVLRNLFIQALITLIVISFALAKGLSALGLPIYRFVMWSGVFFIFITSGFMLIREDFDNMICMADVLGRGVMLGMILGVSFGIMYGVLKGMESRESVGMTFGIISGVGMGGAIGVTVDTVIFIRSGLIFSRISSLVAIEIISLLLVMIICDIFNAAVGVGYFVGLNIVFGVIALRFTDYLLVLPSVLFWTLQGGRGKLRIVSRDVVLSLPGIKKQLKKWLIQDWEAGVYNVNQMLDYSRQLIPVVKAVNEALESSPNNTLLSKIAMLVDHTLNWNLIRFCSANFKDEILKNIYKFFFIHKLRKQSLKSLFVKEPRLDTPVRAVCAGFWFWHKGKLEQAEEAFAVVCDLPHGLELLYISQALVAGNEVDKLEDIVDWQRFFDVIHSFPESKLRPGTHESLHTLCTIASKASVVINSQSILNRSNVISRANTALTQLIETVENTCPYPECLIIENIAEKWYDIFCNAAGIISEGQLIQPVLNPYEGYSGHPVTGTNFVPRVEVFQKIETCWASARLLTPLILYGHRRMGKSSILKNLGQSTEYNMVVVYLNMQGMSWINKSYELLFDFAVNIHKVSSEAGLEAGLPPVKDNYVDTWSARRSLNNLFTLLDPQMKCQSDNFSTPKSKIEMTDVSLSSVLCHQNANAKRLILAIDEYELIDEWIAKDRIDPELLPYLQALNQNYKWLGMIFAGLRTLGEMSNNFRSIFYGQVEHIRVGYLPRNDAFRLITQPHPDFLLEYEPDLCEELYRLTNGQPYLIQSICWFLVDNWNERFLQEGESISRTISMEDLDHVLTTDFYNNTGYYFDGVWSNVTKNEHKLMCLLADREGVWPIDELKEICPWENFEIFEETLKLLILHDVIVKESAGIRYASELMRHWVVLRNKD